MDVDENLAVGIDFGTSFSRVAIFRNEKVEIVTYEHGKHQMPSCVTLRSSLLKPFVAGEATATDVHATNVIFGVKRLIGAKIDDPWTESSRTFSPFMVKDEGGTLKLQVHTNSGDDGEVVLHHPVEICAVILAALKEQAEAHIGRTISDAVLAVPCGFNSSQRRAIKDAATIAGLNVLRMIHDSTAAAVAYGFSSISVDADDEEKNILVFDLGGGFLSVSLVSKEGGIYEVKSTAYDNHLGGEEFDDALVKHVINKCPTDDAARIMKDTQAVHRIRKACEDAKQQLSSATKASIRIASLCGQHININTTITRSDFEELCADMFLSAVATVERALKDAKMDKSAVEEIVLVGGSSRIPKIKKLLGDFFQGKELNLAMDAVEAVAYGAAMEAAVLTGVQSEILGEYLLLDVTALSLGIALPNGMAVPLIARNTTIPTKHQQIFTTDEDNQAEFVVKVLEGESEAAKDNKLLGVFKLTGIQAGPRGTPRIVVTFDMDANGILKVAARDLSTGQEENLTILDGAGSWGSARSGDGS